MIRYPEPVTRLGACPTLPSWRGEGGACRCGATGREKPEAYSLEYGEDFSAPRTMQMLAHHSPKQRGSVEQAPIFDRLEKIGKRAPRSLMEGLPDVKAQRAPVVGQFEKSNE